VVEAREGLLGCSLFGLNEGAEVGIHVGSIEGTDVGDSVGSKDGSKLGITVAFIARIKK